MKKYNMNTILELFLKIPIFGLYAIGVTSIVSGDIYAKMWSKSHTNFDAFVSMVWYIIGGLVFISIVKHSDSVGISNVIWNLVGIIGTLLFSYFYFSESISGIQSVGIILAIIAIGLIAY